MQRFRIPEKRGLNKKTDPPTDWKIRNEIGMTPDLWKHFGFEQYYNKLSFSATADCNDVVMIPFTDHLVASISAHKDALRIALENASILDKQIQMLQANLRHYREQIIQLGYDTQHLADLLIFHTSRVKDVLISVDRLDRSGDRGFVYLIKEYHSHTYKIGKTKNVSRRSETFGVTLPFDWAFVGIYLVDHMHQEERALHEMFRDKRKAGEWFDLDLDDLMTIYERHKNTLGKYVDNLLDYREIIDEK